jgi:pimeloyl-ACP methyl ester carboxylesterase
MDPRAIVGAALDMIEGGVPRRHPGGLLGLLRGRSLRRIDALCPQVPEELPALAELLPQITMPVIIINGRHDRVVPLVNAEFLDERLRASGSWSSMLVTSSGRRSPRSTPQSSSTRLRGTDHDPAHARSRDVVVVPCKRPW